LSELIGGPKAPGIGFAIGEDRLVLTLLAQEAAAPQALADAFIAPLGDFKDTTGIGETNAKINAAALALAQQLRQADLRIELGEGSFRLKKSFEAADKTARRIVILGEDELQSGILTVKDFATGNQTKVPRAELAAFLAKSDIV
jgi:histidyl-tRNA synthetase